MSLGHTIRGRSRNIRELGEGESAHPGRTRGGPGPPGRGAFGGTPLGLSSFVRVRASHHRVRGPPPSPGPDRVHPRRGGAGVAALHPLPEGPGARRAWPRPGRRTERSGRVVHGVRSFHSPSLSRRTPPAAVRRRPAGSWRGRPCRPSRGDDARHLCPSDGAVLRSGVRPRPVRPHAAGAHEHDLQALPLLMAAPRPGVLALDRIAPRPGPVGAGRPPVGGSCDRGSGRGIGARLPGVRHGRLVAGARERGGASRGSIARGASSGRRCGGAVPVSTPGGCRGGASGTAPTRGSRLGPSACGSAISSGC